MGTVELNKKVTELKELEQYAKEIDSEIEAIKDELKHEMETRGQEELAVGVFTIRYKSVDSKRFDSKRFQAEHKKLYDKYVTVKSSKRFTCN